MIEALPGFREGILAFQCGGKVTRRDYETVLIPAIERTLSDHARARLYYEIAADFAGFDAGAILEDIKVGIEHPNRWERIAVVSDVRWMRDAVRAFAFLLPGQVRSFRLAERPAGQAWINEDGPRSRIEPAEPGSAG
jgi:hypothetical protein